MALGTFGEVKAEIATRIQKLETCSDYQDLLAATNTIELLKAGCGFYNWLYQTEVVSDDMFSILGESDLNQYGVYSTGTPSLTNPTGFAGCRNYNLLEEQAPKEAQELYFVNDVNAVLNVSDGNKYVVYCLGNSQVEINVAAGGFVYIRAQNNSQVTVNITFTGNICIDTKEDAQVIIDSNNQGLTRGRTFGRSIVNYTGNDGSTAYFKTFITSILNYTLFSFSTLEYTRYNKSQINIV